MKYFFAAVLAASVLTAATYALSGNKGSSKPVKPESAVIPAPAEPVKAAALPLNLPPADAKAYLEAEKPALLDVRTPDEYAAGHLENAVNLDYHAADFKDRLAALEKTSKYLIYCRSGKRSAAALAIMQEQGFTDVHDIAGGINAWISAGYPTVK
ncbi:MAG: rhodanese-like domain-containing protein [Elusimicrobiales bacterium]|jgi:rhodanese-related sulfurtransferase